MRIIAVFACLAAVACSGTDDLINGSKSSVMVRRNLSVESATAVAVRHCAQYNRDARLAHSQGFIMSFDCVE